MKLIEMIEYITRLKPSVYAAEDITTWIAELDRSVFEDIISAKEGQVILEFVDYTYGIDDERELLAPDRFKDMYFFFVAAKMDFLNRDTVAYQNDMIMYNNYYEEYANWYQNRHIPLQPARIRV